jgi:hypothetical protein
VTPFLLLLAAMKDAKKAKKVKRTGGYEDVEKAVVFWFHRQRRAGITVSGPMLVEAGSEFFKRLHPDQAPKEFSEGWAKRVASRHHLRDTKACGESRSADTLAAVTYRNEFKIKYVDGEEYDLRLIFNVDETGLFFRMLPERTLASKIEERKVKG